MSHLQADSMLRFYISCHLREISMAKDAKKWALRTQKEMRESGLFENVTRFISAQDGKSFIFGLTAINEDCLEKADERFSDAIKDSFNRNFGDRGSVVVVAGELEIL